MHEDFLFKGFEIELFTGTFNSHVGISSQIEQTFSNFVKEPDNRNVEYITAPHKDYKVLYEYLINPRKELRRWLQKKNLTIIPSSTLCFKHENHFQRSDHSNIYHEFIEKNYGISVATSSVHINLGIGCLDKLFAAIRLVRCEAALYLALSASSPFLNEEFTGNHSQRWIQFPKTPKEVPLFENHQHYASWIERNMKDGNMQNVRHFWSSIRPNGPNRPYELDRLELRICDFISDTKLLLALTAFLELRTLYLFENLQELDPISSSEFDLNQLQNICDRNEMQVARNSLNADLINWKDGKLIRCHDWIRNILQELTPISCRLKMSNILQPIYQVLEEGNQSMQWINKYQEGSSIEEIMKAAMENMMKNE